MGWREPAEKGAYFRVGRELLSEANRYARENCQRYFEFQRRWPISWSGLWDDVALKSLFTGERQIDRSAITGRFPVIRPDDVPAESGSDAPAEGAPPAEPPAGDAEPRG